VARSSSTGTVERKDSEKPVWVASRVGRSCKAARLASGTIIKLVLPRGAIRRVAEVSEEPNMIRIALDLRRAVREGAAGIASRQKRRLAGLVAHARANSPFYQRLYGDLRPASR
jgi:hypothetical protein